MLYLLLLIPFLVALIICLVWKGQMKTAYVARQADKYIPDGGFKLTVKSDTLLYKTTTREKIEARK
jgi:hypothetical protein